MLNSAFVQNKGLFSFSATACLRNAYFHNDCRNCMDLCPQDAFVLVRNKLTLLEAQCVECAACIGSCPTEALRIESFDPNAFTLTFPKSETNTLSCKTNTPCLGVFDVHHFIAMGLNSQSSMQCDLSHCQECALNEQGNVEWAIRKKIAQSNAITDTLAQMSCIEIIEKQAEEHNARRALFRTALTKVHEVIADDSGDKRSEVAGVLQRMQTALPQKYTILKQTFKEHIEQFPTTTLEGMHPLFFNKHIDFDTCTNCGDCIQFCPTEALFATSDKQGIVFKSGMCIGCGICDDICKSNAIATVEGIDLVSIAFDRGEELVHYEMVMCHECRCPYPYKGGDPLCDRCKDFKGSFENMFVLAKDQ